MLGYVPEGSGGWQSWGVDEEERSLLRDEPGTGEAVCVNVEDSKSRFYKGRDNRATQKAKFYKYFINNYAVPIPFFPIQYSYIQL